MLEVSRDGRACRCRCSSIRCESDGTTYRPDFAWPDRKVFAEYYGLAVPLGASAVVARQRAADRAVGAGWLPLVFTDASSDREIVERTDGGSRLRQSDRRCVRP